MAKKPKHFTPEQVVILEKIIETHGTHMPAIREAKKTRQFLGMSNKTLSNKLYNLNRAKNGYTPKPIVNGGENPVFTALVKAIPKPSKPTTLFNKNITGTSFEGDELVITYELRLNLSML